MQTVHARKPHHLEPHRSPLPDVLLAERHHMHKRPVARALDVRKADRRLVHEELKRLGSARRFLGGAQDEGADAHGLVELSSSTIHRVCASCAGSGLTWMFMSSWASALLSRYTSGDVFIFLVARIDLRSCGLSSLRQFICEASKCSKSEIYARAWSVRRAAWHRETRFEHRL